MTESELKECVGRNGRRYLVSEDGLTVVSAHTQRALKQSQDLDGYYRVGGIPVHQLVATAWIGPRTGKEHVVDHINQDKTDNRVENLRWTTRRVNKLNS